MSDTEKPSWEWRQEVEALKQRVEEHEARHAAFAKREEGWAECVARLEQQLAEARRGQSSCEPGLSREGLLVLLDSIKRGDDTALAIIVAEFDRLNKDNELPC